jgi:hypothetical protein
MRRTIEALVGPPKVDPEVDRVIAEEAVRGALRPPEAYDVGYGLSVITLDAASILESLLRNRD